MKYYILGKQCSLPKYYNIASFICCSKRVTCHFTVFNGDFPKETEDDLKRKDGTTEVEEKR